MKYITVTLVNLSILGLAYTGMNFDDRFLDLYQFVMWTFSLLNIVALLVPSENIFKEESNNSLKNLFNWIFIITKILVSVWVGMSFLAATYLVVTILYYAKKKEYFDGLTNNKEE